MESWLLSATRSLTDNIKNQSATSYLKNILCLLIIHSKLNMLHVICRKSEHIDLARILLQNLAINSSSSFQNEVKIFWKAYGQSFLQTLLNFINEIINSHSLVTEWIFAIPIVHILSEQHNNLNTIGWNEDPSKFKYALFVM